MYIFTCAITLGSHLTHPRHSLKQEDQWSAAATFAHGLACAHGLARLCPWPSSTDAVDLLLDASLNGTFGNGKTTPVLVH
uniref:Uncharacterized protein n=1 Tax=Romanomermis culicivorax TaxID=13658 RepID=A0A915ICF8_ROMCU